MPTLTEGAIFDALRNVQEPELGRDIVTLNMVKEIAIDGADVAFTIELTTPACPLKDEIERNVNVALREIGVDKIAVTWGSMVRRATPQQPQQLLPGVKNVIAVASGKGGVGKSTISVNLAVSLAQSGAAVGLLDADITGPNIPMMLGVEGQPVASANNKITPLERHGVKCISIQFFVPEGQPIVWRGPLVGGAIQQFLRDVEWGDLDYLVIDLPPGTSDAQLTLAQAVPLGGAVLVTTPQEVSLSDVDEGPRDVQAAVGSDPRRRREHDGLRLPPLRRGDRDLRARRRGAVRSPARHRLPRRRAARHHGPPGRRRRRARGRSARAGAGREGPHGRRRSRRGAGQHPRRSAEQQPVLSIS